MLSGPAHRARQPRRPGCSRLGRSRLIRLMLKEAISTILVRLNTRGLFIGFSSSWAMVHIVFTNSTMASLQSAKSQGESEVNKAQGYTKECDQRERCALSYQEDAGCQACIDIPARERWLLPIQPAAVHKEPVHLLRIDALCDSSWRQAVVLAGAAPDGVEAHVIDAAKAVLSLLIAYAGHHSRPDQSCASQVAASSAATLHLCCLALPGLLPRILRLSLSAADALSGMAKSSASVGTRAVSCCKSSNRETQRSTSGQHECRRLPFCSATANRALQARRT